MNQRKTIYTIVLIFCILTKVYAADWATWRGPHNNGMSNETGWNPKAIEKLDIAWQVNVGIGWSAVSVKNGKVYTMGNINNKDIVYCLDEKTGDIIWKFSYDCEAGDWPGPRCTPVYDNGKIYTLSRNGQLFCLDAQKGTVIWKREILSEYEIENLKWGFASSARIDGDMLMINASHSGLAFDKSTGKEIWAGKSGIGNYAVPVIYTMNNTKYAAIFSCKSMLGIELATGKVVWEYPWETSWDINAADPIFFDNKIFLTSGYKTGCTVIDITNNQPKEIWKNNSISAQFGSCILIDGYIYGPSGNCGRKNSSLCCIDANTGELQWEEELGFNSIIAVDGKLISVNETGELFIAEVNNKEYTEISRANVIPATKKNPAWTAPVFANGHLYCRNNEGDIVRINMN